MNEIKINCSTKDYLPFTELSEFQGNLKSRTDDDTNKIIKSIKKYGFSFPFFVWQHDGINHVLDGHGRLGALRKLDDLGFSIPLLPVVYVDCANEKEACDLLLRLNSQYGKMTKESVLNFIGDFELDLTNFSLPSGTIDFLEEKPKLEKEDDEKETFEILVNCKNSMEQERIFNELIENGYDVRII